MAKATNTDITRVLRNTGKYLSMGNANPFRIRAYERAAEAIESLEEELSLIYKRGGDKALEAVPGVGSSIKDHIVELLRTGRLKEYEALKKKTPVRLEEFAAVEGLGPKSIKKLYGALGVRTAKELERAARRGKVRGVPGFGAKAEENILRSLDFSKKFKGRVLLAHAEPTAQLIEKRIKALPGTRQCVAAGSFRRRKESVGDLDFLVVTDRPAATMNYFVSMPEVGRVLAHGKTKSAVTLTSGLDVDLRVVPEESYGAALNYFTGSKEHNIALREIAIKKGMKMNEYGLFRGKKMIAGESEKDIYAALGLVYVEPELREDTGEIETALRQAPLGVSRGRQGKRHDELPKIVGYNDLRGDLQVHTTWSDGTKSIEEMARGAAKRGFSYIAITDHSKRLAMTHGLDERKLLKQAKEIDRANKTLRGKITILKGIECDILKDGSLDLKDSALAKLDVVGVSVHSYFNLDRKTQTERIIRAIENPHVDILFHPTGRLIGRREAYDVDIDAVIRAAKRTGTILEIDAFPDRLDLKDEHIKKCVEAGVKLSIDSDAHAPEQFGVLEYGLAQARRGWATKSDIVNTRNLPGFKKLLK